MHAWKPDFCSTENSLLTYSFLNMVPGFSNDLVESISVNLHSVVFTQM